MKVKKLDDDRILIQLYPGNGETVISAAAALELFNGLEEIVQPGCSCPWFETELGICSYYDVESGNCKAKQAVKK